MWLTKHDYKHSSDEELMLFIAKQDIKAFNELYARYNKQLHYFFYRMLYADKAIADDMLQELFMKVIEKPYLFDTSKRFSIWIYATAGNMCKNQYRSKIRNPTVNGNYDWEQHADKGAQNRYDSKLFNQRQNEELYQLEEPHRLSFVLRYQQDLSIKEIAAIMNCAEGTVKSRLFYAIRKLANKLEAFREGIEDEMPVNRLFSKHNIGED